MRALQHRECTTAVLAGVNMVFDPAACAIVAMAGMSSAGGHCHTFDKRADGYVRSDACAAATARLVDEAAGATTTGAPDPNPPPSPSLSTVTVTLHRNPNPNPNPNLEQACPRACCVGRRCVRMGGAPA